MTRASPIKGEKLTNLLSRIKELYDQGLSDPQIATELNMSDSNIQRHRWKNLKLPAHNTEIQYETDMDRTAGYMIRNIKFTANRRGFEFDLTYKDIILPKVCPLLEIPLVYRGQGGHSND